MGKRQIRKQYLINKRFQINMAIRFFACLLLVAIASGWAVYYAVWKAVIIELHGVQLARLYHVIGERILFYGLGAIIALSVLSIFFSHKIAGPVYKMKKTIDEFLETEDKPGTIRLRKGDAFTDLADSLNRLFSKILLFP
ncbi:MAG: hypothetical protein JRJ40_11270 [Deltaproteobacteria bacterium]|nr:hypothetical protein [Deltaproteobacteria bacterium]